jgi:hypothetical protein
VTLLFSRRRLATIAVAGAVAGVTILTLIVGSDADRSVARGAVASSSGSEVTEDSSAGTTRAASAHNGTGPLIRPAEVSTAPPDSPVEPGVEFPPEPPEEGAEVGLPDTPPPPPLLSGPAPEPATALDTVVKGFPAGIPVAGRSAVLSSDVAVEGERVRASLTATTPSAAVEVVTEYDEALAASGFSAADSPAIGGSTARTYGRGAEVVTVTVTPTVTGGSDYSVLALLSTPR